LQSDFSRGTLFHFECFGNQVNAGELGRRGHSLDLLVAETFGEEQTSILMTADLWKKNISAYVGPQETCIHEGRMAAAFNIPMISYVSKLIFVSSTQLLHVPRFSYEYYIRT